jgi:hypothetical protein
MENEKSKVVTFEDLVKYTEEVLFPGLEDMMDEKIGNFGVKMDKRFDVVDQRFSEVDQELAMLRKDLQGTNAKVDNLTKMVMKDLAALGDDSLKTKARVSQLEVKFLQFVKS